jgi:hypothetical protein
LRNLGWIYIATAQESITGRGTPRIHCLLRYRLRRNHGDLQHWSSLLLSHCIIEHLNFDK